MFARTYLDFGDVRRRVQASGEFAPLRSRAPAPVYPAPCHDILVHLRVACRCCDGALPFLLSGPGTCCGLEMGVDINAHLPIEAGQLAQEAKDLADHAENTLRSILLHGSTRAVKPLLAFLKLKHRVSYAQLARITQLLFAIFEVSKGDVGAETRVAATLTQALHVLNKLEDCPAAGSPDRLVIAWRPIYDAILRVSLRGASWADFAIRGGDQLVGAEAAKSHSKALVGLARRARNFLSFRRWALVRNPGGEGMKLVHRTDAVRHLRAFLK